LNNAAATPGNAAASTGAIKVAVELVFNQRQFAGCCTKISVSRALAFVAAGCARTRLKLMCWNVPVQNVAAGPDGSAAVIGAVKAAAEQHATGGTTAADVQRLALLSCLRFEERKGDICMAAGGAAPAQLTPLATALLNFGGSGKRTEDIFGGGLLGNVRRMMSSSDMSAYMQHVPVLKAQLEACAECRLDPKKYPVSALSSHVAPATHLSGVLEKWMCSARCVPAPL
jgi:hypothetical protein